MSNDNAFSARQFRTLKHQPDYPGRFTDMAHARTWCEDYLHWYNFRHHHSALARFTPVQVFTGQYVEIAEQRQAALQQYYDAHAERFVRGRPRVAMPPTSALINPVIQADASVDPTAAVNFPTLSAAKKSLVLN